jgi:hypothetical protein
MEVAVEGTVRRQHAIYSRVYYYFIPAESHSRQTRLALHPRLCTVVSTPRLFGPPHDLGRFGPSSRPRVGCGCAVVRRT